MLAALLAAVMGLMAVAGAQEERPQITPGERKVARKKEAGPRALAVLQMAANGKATLLPVVILVDGKYFDATAYKADPVPMALETGTVYEAEHTGSSVGLFTVSSALHSNAVNVASPWLGTGNWLPGGRDDTKKELKADVVPVGIDNSDAPPRLTRDPAAVKAAPAAAPTSSSTPTSTSASTPKSGSSGSDEPPRLTAPASSNPPSSNPAGSNPAGSNPAGSNPGGTNSAPGAGGAATTPASPDAKSGDTKQSGAKADDRPKAPESDSGASEGNRPRLRRGKPVEALPDDEVPGYSKPGMAATPSAGKTDAGAASQGPVKQGPVQLIPAISDASGPEPRSFTFDWLKTEESERRQQMTDLAKAEIRAYVEARAKAKIVPKPAGAQAARRTPAKKTADPILENPQMVAYDLWANNQPILVFAADAHMPPAAGAVAGSADPGLQYTIMLVARTDIYNNLHKLYVGVTDKFHLDLTPRLELIDAVDADGDGRGELLFRETSDNGTGWLIYRATADKLWKLYDSLNPE